MTAVLVIAKAPVPGLAKTRLCPPATPGQAADIAAASLLDTLESVRATPGVVPAIAVTGDFDRAARADELREALRGWTVFPQRGDDFAARLAAAHADTARAHPDLPIVQIGMDTPQVTPELLADASGRLAEPAVDAVLGFAEDGGWWIVGFRFGESADALRNVPMSRPDTGERTLRALRESGLRVETLPVLSDVDDMEAASAVAAQLPGSRFTTAVTSPASGCRSGDSA